MDFCLNKIELLDALSTLIKITPNRTTLPILSTVFIKTTGGEGVVLRTTDLEVDLEISVDSQNLEQGEVCCPIHKLYDVVNTVTEEFVSINVNEANRMRIKTKTGKYLIVCQKTEEFPDTREFGEKVANIEGQFLYNTIKNTIYACSKDELKPMLNGVLLEVKQNTITAVSTDGHRLVKFVVKQTNEETCKVLIPQKFLNTIATGTINTKKATLEIHQDYALIKTAKQKLSTRLITEKFPDYENVIPTENPQTTTVKTQDLLNVVKRVSLMSNKTTKQVVLKLSENKVVATAEDHETGGSAVDETEASHSGDECTIGFNGIFLLEILRHQKTENIKLLTNTPLSAMLINQENEQNTETTTLLMPIRI